MGEVDRAELASPRRGKAPVERGQQMQVAGDFSEADVVTRQENSVKEFASWRTSEHKDAKAQSDRQRAKLGGGARMDQSQAEAEVAGKTLVPEKRQTTVGWDRQRPQR